MRVLVFFILLALLLSGCATLRSAWKFISEPPPYYEKTPEERQDYEEGYAAGYRDGEEDAEDKADYYSANSFYWSGTSRAYQDGYEWGYYEAYHYGD